MPATGPAHMLAVIQPTRDNRTRLTANRRMSSAIAIAVPATISSQTVMEVSMLNISRIPISHIVYPNLGFLDEPSRS